MMPEERKFHHLNAKIGQLDGSGQLVNVSDIPQTTRPEHVNFPITTSALEPVTATLDFPALTEDELAKLYEIFHPQVELPTEAEVENDNVPVSIVIGSRRDIGPDHFTFRITVRPNSPKELSGLGTVFVIFEKDTLFRAGGFLFRSLGKDDSRPGYIIAVRVNEQEESVPSDER